MTKKILSFMGILIFISITGFFSFFIFLKFFFNSFTVTVPDIRGLSPEQAVLYLKEHNLKIKEIGSDYSDYEKGIIFSQLPLPNKYVKKGRTIKIWTSTGLRKIKVPDFTNMDLVSARVLAEKSGLKVKNHSYVHHKFDFNKVISSDPWAGQVVNHGSEISFLLSIKNNSKFMFMPDIIGLEFEKAKNIVNDNNLIIGKIEYIKDIGVFENVVLDTQPKSGDKIIPGTIVNIIVNKY